MSIIRLIKILIVVFAVFAAASVCFLILSSRADAQIIRAYENRHNIMEAQHQIRATSNHMSRATRDLVMGGATAQDATNELELAAVRLQDAIDMFISAPPPPPAEASVFQQAVARSEEMRAIESLAIEAVSRFDISLAMGLIFGESYVSAGRDFVYSMDSLGHISDNRLQNEINTARSMHNSFGLLSTVTMLLLAASAIIGTGLILQKTKHTDKNVAGASEQTKSEEHEAKLQEQTISQRVQSTLDATPLIIELWNKNYDIIDCNQTTMDFSKSQSKEDYIRQMNTAKNTVDINGKPTRYRWNEYLDKAFDCGSISFEYSMTAPSGEAIFLEVEAVSMTMDGELIVVTFSKDVSSLKHAEISLRYHEGLIYTMNRVTAILLTTSEEYTLDAIMDGMEIVGHSLDMDRVQIWRNEMINGELHFVMRYEWLSDLGKQKKEVPLGLSCPYSQSNDWYLKFVNGWHVNGPISNLSPEEESFLGYYEMVSIVILPLFLNGEFIGFFSVDDCKHERVLSEEEMDMLAASGLMFTNVFNRVEQERKNNEKSRFLAKMSHEIRTPITAVLGIAEIQLQNPNMPSVTEEAFAKIFDTGNLLLGIVNEILDLSKIEAGKMEIFDGEYQVESLISDAIQLHLATLSSRNLEFQMEIDEQLPTTLIGDALRIKQIMNNILSNAFKYTTSGSIKLSLQSEPDSNGGIILIISIADTGLGMTQEQIEALSTDYTRFHEQQTNYEPGTGLGMSIVYNLAQMMDANIDVESAVGIGTKVVARIPQKVATPNVFGKELARNLENFGTAGRTVASKFKFVPKPMPHAKVLVVDDIQVNLHVACGLLAFYDLQVETCSSGSDAIEKVANGNKYDIIFMDQMMPDMDGTEAMLAIRNMGYNAPIIAFTANAIIGQAEEFLKNGFDGFLSKPIITSHLDAILTRYIKDKQGERHDT